MLLSSGKKITFRAPGAMHHAWWMSKAIYSIKIYLFKDQFKLTARELKGLIVAAMAVMCCCSMSDEIILSSFLRYTTPEKAKAIKQCYDDPDLLKDGALRTRLTWILSGYDCRVKLLPESFKLSVKKMATESNAIWAILLFRIMVRMYDRGATAKLYEEAAATPDKVLEALDVQFSDNLDCRFPGRKSEGLF